MACQWGLDVKLDRRFSFIFFLLFLRCLCWMSIRSLKLGVMKFTILACFPSLGAPTGWILSTFFLMWSLSIPTSCTTSAIIFSLSSSLVVLDPGALHLVTITHDLWEYCSPFSTYNRFPCTSLLSLVFTCFTTVSSLLMVSIVPSSLSNRVSSSLMISCYFRMVSLSLLPNVVSGLEAAGICDIDFVLLVDVVLTGVLCTVFPPIPLQ